jgi:hypothetical protein
MKRVLALVAALAFLLPCSPPIAQADMSPPSPRIPERRGEVRDTNDSMPAYAIAGGVVAVTMAGAFAALVYIRKRNGK